MRFLEKNAFVIATFVVSSIIMSTAFALQQVFPFGDKHILVVDSWHQYYPFLQELHHKLTSGGSLFYTWHAGSGKNFWLLMAYYAMSPFYLLSVFFPREYLREFMVAKTILNISLAGSFFAFYLRSRFKKHDGSILVFGLMYAFCGYLMGYYWNIMWLDAIALLPLVALGLERTVEGKSSSLFVATMAVTLISNFYIGYMVCLFVFLYFFVLYFSRNPSFDHLHFINNLLRVGISSILSIGMAAVVLLPTYRGLQLAYQPENPWPPGISFYSTILDILYRLNPFVPPTVTQGLPNIHGSLLLICLLGLYFFLGHLPFRTRLLHGSLVGFLFLSMYINYLNYIWHGFKVPNAIPHRFSFIFTFLVLVMAYQVFDRLAEVRTGMLWKAFAWLGVFLIIGEKLYAGMVDSAVFSVGLAFLAVYALSIMLFRCQRLPKKHFMALMIAVIILETGMSAYIGTKTVGTFGRSVYPEQYGAVQQALQEIQENDPGFSRIEMTGCYSINDPALYGYRGASLFSSTANAGVTTYAQRLGMMASPASNRYVYASSTPLVNGLFSIKYLISRDDAGSIYSITNEIINTVQGVTVYQNRYHLPLGFIVNPSIKDWDIHSLDPFEVQEQFLRLATGEAAAVFNHIPITHQHFTNVELTEKHGIRQSYQGIEPGIPGSANISYLIPGDAQVYLYLSTGQPYGKAAVRINDISRDYYIRTGHIIDLGFIEKGTEVEVSFEVDGAHRGYFDLKMVSFDEKAYGVPYQLLARQPFQVTSYSDTRVKGSVQVLKEGRLYLSIPYEPGWTARVNGEKVPVIPIAGAMISLPLPEGIHEVELVYIPGGFIPGSIISALSWTAFILLRARPRRRN